MVAERFAGMNIRQVHFDEGNLHREQCIPQRDAGVGERGRIDDDEADILGPFARCTASTSSCSALLCSDSSSWPAEPA